MRGWPVRGIGPGGRPLIPYESGKTIFNDRTGDIQFEINAQYRYDIAKIIPNTLTLKGAIFTDIGNIWNMNNTKLDGTADSSQFKLKDFYRQLGVTAGTGFRLDFNYFVVRLDKTVYSVNQNERCALVFCPMCRFLYKEHPKQLHRMH